MEIIHIGLNNVKFIGNLSICLGYFDAFHNGHVALINKAKEKNTKVGLVTMEPNPKAFFSKGETKYINSFLTKCKICESLGVDYFIVIDVNWDFLSLSPDDFIDKIIAPLGVVNIICGYDYTFGKNKLGNANTLLNLSNTRCFNVDVVEEVKNEEGIKISTSFIKDLILNNRIEEANKYLYQPFSMIGIVEKGNHLGTGFGFATANIQVNKDYLYPSRGVYGGKCIIDGKTYLAMINVGTHPTVKESKTMLIEAHVLDFSGDLYNKRIEVIFEYYIREEVKFASIDDLIKQLQKDELKIRQLNQEK